METGVTRRHAIAGSAAIMIVAPTIGRPASVRAEEVDAGDPALFIAQLANSALQNISGADVPPLERERRFRTVLSENFDMPRIARFMLGRYWNEASAEQRMDFTALLQDYLVTNYASRFVDYGGSSFRSTGVRADDPGVLVLTEMLRRQGAPIRVNWRLTTSAPPFKIVDVFIENISMALTQRSEFASVIQRNGGRVDDLLVALRGKLGSQTSN